MERSSYLECSLRVNTGQVQATVNGLCPSAHTIQAAYYQASQTVLGCPRRARVAKRTEGSVSQVLVQAFRAVLIVL